jgi:hypothetical protein
MDRRDSSHGVPLEARFAENRAIFSAPHLAS